MRNVLRVGILLLVAVGACGEDSSAGPSSPFELEGRVLDDLSGAGVDSAQVTFSSDALDHAETTTDPNGRYTLHVRVREGVEFGIVSAKRDGYEPGAARTVYFDGSTHVIDLTLRSKTKSK